MPLTEIKDKARRIKFARAFLLAPTLTGQISLLRTRIAGCELEIAFGIPAEDFFGLCFFDLLFELAENLGEGLGSAAWITALQLRQ